MGSFDKKNEGTSDDEENESVLNEKELQEKSLSYVVCETKENQNKFSRWK